MPTTFDRAIELAYTYIEDYDLQATIDRDKTEFRDSFYQVDGAVWLIVADTPPSNLEGMDEITIVVSIEKDQVDHIINRSGFLKYLHLEGE